MKRSRNKILLLAGAALLVVGLPAATLTTTYAFQINHRREYEQVRESVDGPQYDFILRTHSVDAEWAHTPRVIREGLDLEGGVGLTSAFQENVYAGLPLIPNHRSFTGGVFGYERLNTPKGAVDLGARYDHQSRTSFLTGRRPDTTQV